MISDITENFIYCSPSGIPFRVKEIAAHGQDCSLSMIVYENLEATKDYPAFKTWVLPESLFVKQFSEYSEGKFYERNNAVAASNVAALESRKAFRLAFSESNDSTASWF